MCWNCRCGRKGFKRHFLCFDCRRGWKSHYEKSICSSCRKPCDITTFCYKVPKHNNIKEWKRNKKVFVRGIDGLTYKGQWVTSDKDKPKYKILSFPTYSDKGVGRY